MSVRIVSPVEGANFELNNPVQFQGIADGEVVTVSLFTPFDSNIYRLGSSPVSSDGKWSITSPFNSGGRRKIVAEGLSATGNPVDFDTDEVEIIIDTGFTKPIRVGRVTSPFGPRSGRFHRGVDIGALRGTAVHAVADGKVILIKTSCTEGDSDCGGGFGNRIEIDHPDKNLRSLYAHLQNVEVSSGILVSKGQRIATVGSTGRSTGPHLHLEIRREGVAINPENFIIPIT